MQIAAESTDTAIADLKLIIPAMADQVALKLGIPVQKVEINNWVVIPYFGRKEE